MSRAPSCSPGIFYRTTTGLGAEVGRDGLDGGWGAGEAVRAPSVDLVPAGGHLPHHVGGRSENISAIAEEGEKKSRYKPMAQKGRKAHLWGR